MKKAKTKKKRNSKKTAQGDRYACDSCGLVVEVANACDCEDACDIMCCGSPMECVVAG